MSRAKNRSAQDGEQTQIQKEKTFRISAKRIMLTYSQVNTEMSPEDVLEQLKNKPSLGRFNYLIAKELHDDGGVHFHVVLINYTKFSIRSETLLDLEYQGTTYHGHYKPVKYYARAIEYVCKHNQYITDIEHLIDGRICDERQLLFLEARRVGVDKALVNYTINNPKKAFPSTSVSSLKKNFKDVQEMENNLRDDLLTTPFKPENFNLQGALKEWNDNPDMHKNKALLLVGESGIGKTSYAKVFCASHGLKPLFVNHREGFKRINSSYDAVIIDDANLSQFEDTQILALLDNSAPKTLRVMYQSVRKKRGVVMIVLMNRAQFKKLYPIFTQDAYARRVVIYEPKQPFMINVNITNNTNNSIFNQNNTFQQHVKEDQQLIEDNRKRCVDILHYDS